MKRLLSSLLFAALVASGCSSRDASGVPRNAVRIGLVVNASAAPWVEEAARTLNDGRVKSGNRPVFAELTVMEAGPAVAELAGSSAALWIPDDEAWTDVLAQRGNANFKADCVSVARSPLVIGMWKDIADALGYPARTLGWLDLSSLAADPQAWQYYTGGQYGRTLRLAHGHPGLTASGANTLLAVAQAAKQTTTAVTAAELAQAQIKASIGAFEGGVGLFASSTEQLGQTMIERGPQYLGAGVMYESTLARLGKGELVPVYPFEGTFVATHPACVNGAASAEQQAAARAFRDALLGDDAQKLAVESGLRPAKAAVKTGPPLDADSGVDLKQPSVVYPVAGAASVAAAQDVWKVARKPAHLVMVLDTSGSMSGDKIASMRSAAVKFVEQMNNEDVISIVAFSTTARTLMENQKIAAARTSAANAIRGLNATGNTALYDAVVQGASLIAKYNSSQRANLMVVLTDGLDTSSRRKFDAALIRDATANNTSLYTIAYGGDADKDKLDSLAKQSNGDFFEGSEANIAEIYQEMSAAFGGNVGVGR